MAKLKALYYYAFKRYEALLYLLLQMGKDNQKAKPITPENLRKGALLFSKILSRIQKIPESVALSNGTLGGRAARIARPKGAPNRVILYLHGGGFVIPLGSMYDAIMAELAQSCDAEVWAIDYRVAPENTVANALDDSYAAYLELLEKGVAPYNIHVMGDSAGGFLILALALRLRDEGKPLPNSGVALSPVTGAYDNWQEYPKTIEVDPFISKEFIAFISKAVLDGNTWARQGAPFKADLRGLPRLLIVVGGKEVLLEDNVRFVEKAKAAGVDATLDLDEKMFHIYPAFVGLIPEARGALARITAFITQA